MLSLLADLSKASALDNVQWTSGNGWIAEVSGVADDSPWFQKGDRICIEERTRAGTKSKKEYPKKYPNYDYHFVPSSYVLRNGLISFFKEENEKWGLEEMFIARLLEVAGNQ